MFFFYFSGEVKCCETAHQKQEIERLSPSIQWPSNSPASHRTNYILVGVSLNWSLIGRNPYQAAILIRIVFNFMFNITYYIQLDQVEQDIQYASQICWQYNNNSETMTVDPKSVDNTPLLVLLLLVLSTQQVLESWLACFFPPSFFFFFLRF